MKLSRMSLVGVLAGCVVATAAMIAHHQAATLPPSTASGLAAFAPQGGLLVLESPDFAALVKAWMSSPEEQRWLTSDNYGDFSRSRLFGQLGEAQNGFVATAGLPVDARFVQQVAGRESILVLYDIRSLEFLYITRMPAGEAEKPPLLALRSKFEERKVGDTSFYVRTDGSPTSTVAFAVRGEYLLLATNSDKMAAALQLMQQPTDHTLKNEAWYANSVTAAARQPGDLRMTLNLAEIVKSPYFRTYWVQQNLTQMKQYSAVLSDLYRDAGVFREERVLLKNDPEQKYVNTDLSPVLAYAPAKSGVYRAVAQPDAANVLEQIQDKVLDRAPVTTRNAHLAPAVDISTPQAGDTSNLEQRIDEQVVMSSVRLTQLKPLSDLLSASPAQAMLVYSATETPANGLTMVHSGVALSATGPWNAAALQTAISAALSPKMSVGTTGLSWMSQKSGNPQWVELNGMQPLAMAVSGNVCVLATDRATLMRMLNAAAIASHPAQIAGIVAGFNHSAERDAFSHITSTLDQYHPDKAAVGKKDAGTPPPFFAGNMAGLSNTFQNLDAETFVETVTPDNAVHQSVRYEWTK
jgi:hypothetical protein